MSQIHLIKQALRSIISAIGLFSGVHVGLEGGMLIGKIPDMDVISIGPDIFEAHSPDERVSISSVARTWEFLNAILRNIHVAL
jgi:di/tripeptidase